MADEEYKEKIKRERARKRREEKRKFIAAERRIEVERRGSMASIRFNRFKENEEEEDKKEDKQDTLKRQFTKSKH